MVFLISYGHSLTVMVREGYEFQGPGVDNPRLLRDANEILHRVFNALKEAKKQSASTFSIDGLSHWIRAEERSKDIQVTSIQAFKWALKHCYG